MITSINVFADSEHNCQGNSCNGGGEGNPIDIGIINAPIIAPIIAPTIAPVFAPEFNPTFKPTVISEGGDGGTGIGIGIGIGGKGGEGGKGGDAKSNSSSKSKSEANSSSVSGASASNSLTIVHERQLLAAPAVPATEPTFMQNGKFFDYTYFVTDFVGVTKYNHKLHMAVNRLEEKEGYWFWRYRLEDVEDLVLEAREKYKDANFTWCYRATGKESSVNGTTGGGISGSQSGPDGAATGSILPSMSRVIANPEITFCVYECINRPQKDVVEQIVVK
jgi:hypothetical protein